jgi:Carboxypeptidase regulatory-like domain/TonB dependent receptor
MRGLRSRTIVLVLLGAAFSVSGYAQTFRGAINGTVTDPSGAVVAGASVKATNTATAVAITATTTSGGEFAFQDLPLGTYKVEVAAAGFRPVAVDNVMVGAGGVYTLPVKLSTGAAGTTVVEVAAAALTLDTTTSTQSDTITDKAVQEIPLNGRDFSQLIAVSPGYGGYSVGGFGSLNGTRANQMNWQVDGTDNNDFWHNIPAINQGGVSGIAGTVMPIDAIDEFSAQTQSNAETGRNAGGTVNLVIKSGTNQFHGSAYYYNRNEFYAASSPFFVATPDFPKPPELRNQNYGVTVGGPIIKDKTFFFLGFEKQNYIFGLTGLSTEPSNAWAAEATALINNTGGIYGTYATPVSTSALSQTLLSTLWPSSIQNLSAVTSNYFATVPGTGYSYNEVGHFDHNFNENNHLSGHFFYGQGSQTQPPGASLALATASSNLGYYFEVAPIRIENYSLVFNSVLTSKLTNQVLFGISYFNQIFHDSNNSFNEKTLGLYTSPGAVTSSGQPIMGAPNIVISGFDQAGITPPEGRNDITGHLTDVLSYVMGKHQLRFGGEVRQGRVDEFYFRRSLGSFNFTGGEGPWNGATSCGPGNLTPPAACASLNGNIEALADFLSGNVASSSIAVGNAERKVRVNAFDFFGQDAWQVTRRLSLNLGLRYEYIGPLHSLAKDLPVFIPSQGLEIQGNGIDSIFPPDKNNIAPRVGFSYQPTSREDVVVRGGIGVFYDQINMNPFLDFRPGSAGADGLQDNPIGPSPVDNYGSNRLGQTSYNWDAVQAGGNPIFLGVTTCPALNCPANNPIGGVTTYNVYSVGQNFRTPYFYNYNLQVEKGFGNGAAVWQVGYVGSAGHKLSVMDNLTANATEQAILAAQYPNIGSVLQLNSVGNSNYNALQTTLRIRSWHGFSSQFAYTWAHELDTMTEYRGSIQFDYTNPKLDYGSGDFDTRQNFTAFWTYDVPGSEHGPKLLTHGWQVSGLVSFHGGQPFNFDAGTQRPGLNLIANPFTGVTHTFSAANGGMPWVNPAAFCVPGSTIYGSSGNVPCPGTTNAAGDLNRNAYYGPGFADVDLSVIKNIPVTERIKLQLRAEMFNLLNRKNLATGAGSVGNGTCPVSAACPTGFSGGYVGDTIGDFNGAPGLGPGEPFNLQIAAKIIF